MPDTFADLPTLAHHMRDELKTKKFALIYAYNGTGKTRLSRAFKRLGTNGDLRDTLYFNAFTEDLFQWDNDLEGDHHRVLTLNGSSRFFQGLSELEMDVKIGSLLSRYADFNFYIDYEKWNVTFFRERDSDGNPTPIKVSRGEENIFIWCFFLAVLQLVLDGADAYKWVSYVYIDDPISSLDEHNAISVANHLAQILLGSKSTPPTVVSTHHTLFFNVLFNELKRTKIRKYFLCKGVDGVGYLLREQDNDTPVFQHVSNLLDLEEAQKSGKLFTHHFNVLRSIMEKTASFYGYRNFGDCVKPSGDDEDKSLHTRFVNIMSHGNYSLYEPVEMMEENKELFKTILDDFKKSFPFNPDPFKDGN